MATIKLNAQNKILTKNGKVSCGCCAEPECCMYPAQALVDGLYSYEDLPDAIDVGGIEYLKINPPESVAGFTRYYINSNSEYLGILEGADSLWTYEGGGGPCLINGFNGEGGEREDQFADTYNWLSDDPFTGDPYNPVSTTVTRVSLCRWEGPLLPFVEGTIFCKPVLYLYKGLNDVPNEYAFVWRMQWEGDAAETGGDKIGFNNTPVGEYDADPTPGTWVIS